MEDRNLQTCDRIRTTLVPLLRKYFSKGATATSVEEDLLALVADYERLRALENVYMSVVVHNQGIVHN